MELRSELLPIDITPCKLASLDQGMDATVYADFDDCVSNVCQNETVLIVDSNLSALHSSGVTAHLVFYQQIS
jgi:hypothetical protein